MSGAWHHDDRFRLGEDEFVFDDEEDRPSNPSGDDFDSSTPSGPEFTLLDSSSNMYKLGLTKASSDEEKKLALKWASLASYLPDDVQSIQKFFVHHVEYTLAQTRSQLKPQGAFQALSICVRDRLIERWKDTQIYFQEKEVKRVAYLSLEFLLGRSLQNAIFNLGMKDQYQQAITTLGQNLEDIYESERDAGLGNGGLGRLAACFLDSLASLDIPAWGYGLRYTYGMFTQKIKDGYQLEFPDYWLTHGNPWELERLDVVYPVRLFGHVREYTKDGRKRYVWEGGDEVLAVAYDTPIPGYKTFNTLNIRLWSATPSKEFDLESFSRGDFYKSIEDKQKAESITHVLYPNDNTDHGKELRLKQQYFFVCATISDMMRRFKKKYTDYERFPDLIAIQLNDTHPSLAIAELMRVLIDEVGLEWEKAWGITVRTFAYTNHTVLPEALEKWSVGLMSRMLPRHMSLIFEINLHFLKLVESRWPGDVERLRRMSLIDEVAPRSVRMSNLAIVGSHTVNGVAALHTQLLKETIFKDFFELWPDKFLNMTNGVTPRRWLHQANPALSDLITEWVGSEDWLLDLSLLSRIRSKVDDPEAQLRFASIKRANKERLAALIKRECGITVNPEALFDVQVKRIHEYKRQLLNILSVIHRYRTIKEMSAEERKDVVPRVVIFGGKAAPGYFMAKLVIKLINSVGTVVNHDPEIGDLLKVIFLPNYRVSQAEVIVPASDISQQISTAGTEASGTSNMKFAMNGGLILGTLDGANIEIMEEIGSDNVFIFGALASEVPELRERMRAGALVEDKRFVIVREMIEQGVFGDPNLFAPIVSTISKTSDWYLLGFDFGPYLAAQDQVDRCYKDKKAWIRKTMLSVAGSGKFSSDRTIKEYATKIWNVQPLRRPGPVAVNVSHLRAEAHIPGEVFGTSMSNPIALERLTPVTRHYMPVDIRASAPVHLHTQHHVDHHSHPLTDQPTHLQVPTTSAAAHHTKHEEKSAPKKTVHGFNA